MNRKVKSLRVMSVALSKRAERVVASTKAETGITHLAFLERLLEWYAVQDPRIRTMILSPYAEVRQGLARLIVDDMAAHPARDFDPGLQFDGLIHNDYVTNEVRKRTAAGPVHKSRSARGLGN